MGNVQVVPIHATVLPEQRAMLVQLAKDEGMANVSEALRRVLNDWKKMKAQEAGIELEPAEMAA